jgi:hypothetical protein
MPGPWRQGVDMNTKQILWAAAAGTILTLASVSSAAQDQSFGEAIARGDAGLDLRYRYEFVDQDALDPEDALKDANASTLRIRLNYKTGTWGGGWSGFIEADNVIEVLFDDFNSGSGTSSPRRNDYATVADPKGSDLNQLYFQYAPNDDWQTRVGRQRILLDDQRYVGGVGWRQNEQTYDALSVRYQGFESGQIFYSYVVNVNRIFGNEVPAGDHQQDTHLLNAAVNLTDAWKLTGYAYLIDNDDLAAFSTSTFGLRASGKLKAGEGSFNLLAEFATQSDYGNNPASFDANYFRIQADWSLDRLSVGAGMESLGSDNGTGFITPLATLHLFNGWADQFLSTPSGGIEDLYLKLGFKPGKWNLQLVYHDFSAETGSSDYGTEIDLSAQRKLGNRYGVLLKLADFQADDAPFVDTLKFWVMLTASY